MYLYRNRIAAVLTCLLYPTFTVKTIATGEYIRENILYHNRKSNNNHFITYYVGVAVGVIVGLIIIVGVVVLYVLLIRR